MDPVVSYSAALLLGYVFAGAALHKWRGVEEFEAALAGYQALPARAVRTVARTLPILEAATAVALLVPSWSRFGATSAALLLAAYMLAVAINLARGRAAIDCGCGGPGAGQSLSGWLLLRNGVLLAAAWAAWGPPARAITWLDWTFVVPVALSGCLFYSACNQLLANRRRLEIGVIHRG